MNDNADLLAIRVFELRRLVEVNPRRMGVAMKYVVFPGGLTVVMMVTSGVEQEDVVQANIVSSFEEASARYYSNTTRQSYIDRGEEPPEELIEVTADFGQRVTGIEAIMRQAVADMRLVVQGGVPPERPTGEGGERE